VTATSGGAAALTIATKARGGGGAAGGRVSLGDGEQSEEALAVEGVTFVVVVAPA
jgi:hypothetical protein